MITDYNYNYFFLKVIDYNYRLHCKVIMITLWLLLNEFYFIWRNENLAMFLISTFRY